MEFLTVGKIVNTHALKGELKVVSSSDFTEERFARGNTLYIAYENQELEVEIATHRVHKGANLITFKNMNSINDVEKYKGCELLVSMEDLTDLEENEFYYFEIIGCRVQTTEGDVVGEVTEIMQTGANDVWTIKRDGKKDALIPYIEQVVKSINVEEKLIVIEPLEGLL